MVQCYCKRVGLKSKHYIYKQRESERDTERERHRGRREKGEEREGDRKKGWINWDWR